MYTYVLKFKTASGKIPFFYIDQSAISFIVLSIKIENLNKLFLTVKLKWDSRKNSLFIILFFIDIELREHNKKIN